MCYLDTNCNTCKTHRKFNVCLIITVNVAITYQTGFLILQVYSKLCVAILTLRSSSALENLSF